MSDFLAWSFDAIAEIPLHLFMISFHHRFKCRSERSASFEICHIYIHGKCLISSFAGISSLISVDILLFAIDDEDTIIQNSAPPIQCTDIKISIFIHDANRIFRSVIIYIIIAGITDAIMIKIFLWRIVGIRAVIIWVI